MARILARCLNCVEGPTITPCGVCASCLEIAAGNALDVIEIDAASNRGINEMRELRENVRYRPARDRYKVFIIDEAHQITNEAFNALLEDAGRAARVGGVRAVHHRSAQDPDHHRLALPAVQFPLGGFRRSGQAHGVDLQQEGIEADPEVLSVLAQAGEGSVRDSLSALDQAIACCGDKLDAAEVRGLLGMFSLDSLGEVTQALAAGDAAMLDLVRSSSATAATCSILPRAGALLPQSAGGEDGGQARRADRCVAAGAGAVARGRRQFSEEDLTRYLQLTLDLFKDLQFSLQPRLHLEIGLLRLVQAGRLLPIEEALAALGGGGRPSPAKLRTQELVAARGTRTDAVAPCRAPPQAPAVRQRTDRPASSGRRLHHGAASKSKHAFTADAVEHSTVAETPGRDCSSRRPKIYQTGAEGKGILNSGAENRRPAVRIKIAVGEAAPAHQQTTAAKPPPRR